MARNKSKRDLKFKPKFKSFVPIDKDAQTITLLHEEIEAIYLMDYKNLYQEDAATSMGVSRTTFSRIIKSARTKLATALVNGKKIQIQDEKKELCVAFICDDKENFHHLSIRNEFLVFVKLDESCIKEIEITTNPIYNSDEKPVHVLPELFSSKGINYFLGSDIGEGLKNSLLTKGIFTISKEFIKKDELKAFLHSYM